MPQLDLFGNESSQQPIKKTGGRRGALKHNEGETVAAINEHPDIYINSDGNILRHVSTNGNVHTYTYIKSNTKLGQTVSFTNEGLAKFIASNEITERRELVNIKVLRRSATRLQK